MGIKYLILGNGYLGNRFHDFLKSESVLSETRVNEIESVFEELNKYTPEFVINCIGKTGRPNIDWCESHKPETLHANAVIPGFIAKACAESGSRMVNLGSGCVFEGDNSGKGFSEDDEPNFRASYYSLTKILGEDILINYPVLQLRIRMPFDDIPHPRNLVTKLLGYKKVIASPNSITYVPDLLSSAQRLMDENYSGIFNVVNKDAITHDEILEMYQDISGKRLDYEVISPEQLDKITKARRSNCVLSTEKLERVLTVGTVRSAIRKCITAYCTNIGVAK